MLFFIAWVALSMVVGLIGSDKSIGFWGAFLISIILSPLIGLIVVVLSNSKQDVPPTVINNNIPIPPKPSNDEPALDLPDRIKKFKDLLDAGAITQEEYDIQKKRLLE